MSSTLARAFALYLRVALATAFLSAVADRFGLWGPPGSPGVAWGTFDAFVAYAGTLAPVLSGATLAALGWAVTAAEVLLGLLLLAGLRTREAAAASGVLLLGFALGMAAGSGVKAPLDASVFSASAGAFLLAAHPGSLLSVDGPGADEVGRSSPGSGPDPLG